MWRSKQSQTDELSRPSFVGLAPPITLETSADALHSASAEVQNTAWLKPAPEITGKISGNEDLCINGTFEEPISLKCRRLIVGTRAKVTAQVVAREVVVYGKFCGNLWARDRIEIKRDGAVVGDVISARVLVEEGAYLKGKVEIERRKVPRGLPQKRT